MRFFLLAHAEFVQAQLRGRLEAFEGMARAGGKVRFLMRGLFSFFTRGEKLVFDRNQKYTFYFTQASALQP